MNYYKHHLGDYAKDTGHLSLAEHGAYRLLMDHYYATESALPKNEESLCRICRANSAQEKRAVAFVANHFFQEANGALIHRRIDEELGVYRGKSDKNKENGTKGGRPKKTQTVNSGNPEKTQSVNSGFVLGSEKKPKPITTNPVTNNQHSLTPLPPGGDGVDSENVRLLESVIAAYPMNGNINEAKRALLLIPHSDYPDILEKTRVLAERMKSLPAHRRTYCPGKQKYFEERRWNDDPNGSPWTFVDPAAAPRGRPPGDPCAVKVKVLTLDQIK